MPPKKYMIIALVTVVLVLVVGTLYSRYAAQSSPLVVGGENDKEAGLLGQKIVLFSAVNGVITLDQKPLAGARVTRTVEWKDETYKDEATTSASGSFHLPEMPGPGRIVLAEFVASQLMEVEYQDQKWLIWRMVKREAGPNRELVDDNNWESAGTPIEFSCELSTPTRKIKLLLSVLRTNCQFPAEIGEAIK
ncbi:MAG: hypothetical protein A2675_01335 [Candidatus Yonathbacteria bacterium RIFCSPHIGHO2_01_FULL_51_10]|uniref:DUF6795 domain-containing protein n=1 Tax=Candidatus Yonathbacteria bacterium RIFCSPHIGHO2_01_FULL_51_10 TaxID=1802723 RepID=A0A1G2S5M8_9BACT|nr:MAG: hypothetical protein A2675_01335 [Candidatus Yonathbacteria bacterium RIFCSPHIGHO2_01_FULL_51_10]